MLFVIMCSFITIPNGNPLSVIYESVQTDFEGIINYDLIFEDRTGQLTKEQAKEFMGYQQTYTIKGDKYKSKMNGMMKMTQYYLGEDTLYNQIGGMQNLFWIDAISNPDELVDYRIDNDVETIVGVSCDLLTINSKEGTTKYYFNKKHSVDPANYVKHEYGFWKFCMDKTGALPLKNVANTKDVYMVIVANEVTSMEIDDATFNVPNLPSVVNPEN